MRVPRALEFPAVILTTAVLTFTGVSALQASVNAPLAELAQQRTGDSPSRTDALDAASEVTPASDLPASPASTDSAPSVTVPATEGTPGHSAPEVLANTGSEPVAAEIPLDVAPQPPLVADPSSGQPAPAETAAQSAHAAVAGRPSPAAQPAAPAAAPVQTPAPTHPPTPVSGMDYVWDQVFGSGSFAKPGTPAGSNGGNGNGKAGAGQTCPPGQAKKGNC